MNYPKVILKPGKEQSVRRYHPWIFSGAIKKIKGNPRNGDTVTVLDSQQEFLAQGHYANGSIAVRIVSFSEVDIDADFWKTKVAKAIAYRKAAGVIGNNHTNCYRIIHGEGDGCPGLIIDFYAGTAVVQAHSFGMWSAMEDIVAGLRAALGTELKAVYNKSKNTLPQIEDFENENGFIWGEADGNKAFEYNNAFLIDWDKGQKTGFFVDQRENRKLVGEYSKNRSVLNMFCYTGGFSVYAMQGGATKVHSVDSSERAIELTNENMEINFPGDNRHEAFAIDAFSYFRDTTEKYDVIILDPPAFAKHTRSLNNAIQGYKRLNAKAIEQIKPGGIIFTFSCSQVVNKEDFRKMVFAASANTGRNVRILHQLSQPQDHPVSVYHPEGEYLKGLVLYVE
jgi:23S rRNA (cytosine1962-C5)-methyltransferase